MEVAAAICFMSIHTEKSPAPAMCMRAPGRRLAPRRKPYSATSRSQAASSATRSGGVRSSMRSATWRHRSIWTQIGVGFRVWRVMCDALLRRREVLHAVRHLTPQEVKRVSGVGIVTGRTKGVGS